MCEPFHSIVQYPVSAPLSNPGDSSKGPPFGDSGGDDLTNRLQWGLRKVYDWGKKIGSWFHFSCLGSGHTESIDWAKTKELYLPSDTRLETDWWNRTVKFDGAFHGSVTDKPFALQAATEYANVVAIGNIQKLRRFLETSMQKTRHPELYVERFEVLLLNKQGRDQMVLTRKRNKLIRCTNSNVQQFIRLVLGLTRQRKLLMPVWADDGSLWST